jgi:hypothetical protein
MKNLCVYKSFLVSLIVCISLSGCSPERRAILRMTAINFKNQAMEAIEATKSIYQLNPIPFSDFEIRKNILDRFLEDPDLDFGDIDAVNSFISDQTGTISPSPVSVALEDLKQEYIVASETFDNIERAGLLNSEGDAVAKTAEPARRLTVKMLLLAKIISQNPPTPKNPDRALILFQFEKLRKEYIAATSEEDRLKIRESGAKLLDTLFSVDKEEKALICKATAKLLLTAETGTKLSNLIASYNDNLSIDELVGKINTTLGIASGFGADLISVNTRVAQIQAAIANDPVLNSILNEQPKEIWQPTTSNKQIQCSS